jgi:glycine C-acetyltransferase
MEMQLNEHFDYTKYTLEDFMDNSDQNDKEISLFNRWKCSIVKDQKYTFEVPHLTAQTPITIVQRPTGERLKLLNLASYNYFGYSYHPDVISSAQEAIQTYGLGATGSPVLNGTFLIHNTLEKKLLKFIGLSGYGVSLFSSGYGANVGTISSYLRKGDFVLLDRLAHASLVDGALLSGARARWFNHNDIEHLKQILSTIRDKHKTSKVLICTEGVYSADGDYGNILAITRTAKQYGAKVLVDEAHSFLIAGDTGRGVCEQQDVLKDVDMIIVTFSKSFGGIGGCLIAQQEIVNYVNYYARSRMFSCALDPAVTGGLIKVLELVSGNDGKERRQRLYKNATYLYDRLRYKLMLGKAKTWIIPVIYGDERLTFSLGDYLQKEGLDVSLMMYPAVPKRQARIRLFVTSEHTLEQLEEASRIIIHAAEKFNFTLARRASGAHLVG